MLRLAGRMTAPRAGSQVDMVAHRPDTLEDAAALLDLRRRSILELAAQGLPAGEAETWAAKLTLAGMDRKLRELEIWVAELDGVAAAWGAIRGGTLEGL